MKRLALTLVLPLFVLSLAGLAAAEKKDPTKVTCEVFASSSPEGQERIAAYLDGWKRRIERVGTLNFPNEARRRQLSGNPVLEVAIRANGTLESVIVRRTSGHRELDNAAVGIVRLAAPFEPFPSALRERYPVLRFAYEWQFIDGKLGGAGAVFSSGP